MIANLLIALLTLAAGTCALMLAVRLRRDERRVRGWATLPGKILERDIEPMQTDARSFTPRITYSYTVAGKEYVGSKVYLTGRAGKMKASARRLVDALPDPIPVHYNPENPSEAYLLPAPASIYWIALIFGIGALLWGLVQLTVALQ